MKTVVEKERCFRNKRGIHLWRKPRLEITHWGNDPAKSIKRDIPELNIDLSHWGLDVAEELLDRYTKAVSY